MNSKQRKTRRFNPERLVTLQYLDAEAVERYAPIAKRTYYQAIADGKLRASRIGGTGKLVVRRDDLDQFIAGTPVESKIDALVNEVVREVLGKEGGSC